jgi:sulfide:quinone oxidoreductase
VVSPRADWNWIPSNIWVGVGRMQPDDVVFPLQPVYDRMGITFMQAKALSLNPEGSESRPGPFITIEHTSAGRAGQAEDLGYDFLVNATGPKLNFAATSGLGPDANSLSVCTPQHAAHASAALTDAINAMKCGRRQRLVIGMGHGTCTCEGAAFEYAFNVDHELRQHGVRDQAEIVFLTNEYELGDFGVGGMVFSQNGFLTSSQLWTESLFREREIDAICRAHVSQVKDHQLEYETLDGEMHGLDFDFAMLLPPFKGAEIKAFDQAGIEITEKVFAPSGFMRVDAEYTPKAYADWSASDWPRTYQSSAYDNVFGIGIAFAPPHQMSVPRTSPNGTVITPSPPRTGMPSGVMGRAVAMSIADAIVRGATSPTHAASMAEMGAACIASAGAGALNGTAAAMTMFPIVPDFDRYPETGRSVKDTYGEIGLAAHWIKHLLHFVFIYKAKARAGWALLPE